MALLKHLNAGGTLSIPQRQLLVRLSVSHLTENCGDLYPRTDEKTALAKEIVQTWPATKDATPGLQGHEHFYSEGNGSSFIQSRLKNIRSSQKVRKRGHDGSKRPSLPDDHEEHLQDGEEDEPELDGVVNQQTLEKVEWMKYTAPRQQTKAQLTEVFVDTHKYRQALITQQEMTITDIVNQFPRYRDMPQLIGIEFSLLYGDVCDNFVKKWGTFYRPRIKALAKRDFPTVQQVIADFEESNGDMDVCGLTALLFMLHRPTSRRKGKEMACSRPGALMYLIQNLPVGTDVEAAVQGKESIYRQPFLLSLGEEMKPSQYFLVVDKVPIPAATTTVESFDMVFKSHFAFKVEYASPLMPFYTFMAAFVYEVLPPSQVAASIRSLAANIRNMGEI